ncbi:SDR family oxidoreductase [Fructobacillus tropaeoli]|uniref:SDR family oxidoreductase n=1 Tax=Fructobacillus tropaeoli TaxID=709323 RepID=UPI002DA383F8|nr:Uncharacterized conserved protein YbjT [Fructobacillus tropaeoli]
MTKTLVIGAHGKVGQILVQDLAKNQREVLAAFRNKDQLQTVADLAGVEGVYFDLDADEQAMAQFFMDHQVGQIVFTAGAGGKGGIERTVEVDLDGAIKTMVAAKKASVAHYVMVSAAGADDRSRWSASGIYHYFMMKHYADLYLQNSGLDYTIVRPTLLLDTAGTGKVSLSVDFAGPKEDLQIPRADVASFVTEVLAHPEQSANQIYDLTTGHQNIQNIF